MKFYLSLMIFSLLLVIFIILTPFQTAVDQRLNVLGAQTKLLTDDSAFKIILFGDSMTSFLGPSGDEILSNLKTYYPNSKIVIQNYGFGSKNILFAKEVLEKQTDYLGVKYPPLLQTNLDLLIIESFANNPLSEYPLEEGLKIQNRALDEIISKVHEVKPDIKIVFLATIAPSKTHFGEGSVELTPQKREEWVSERITYLKNHIEYANSHNIPLINVYEKSLKDGDGNKDFLNPGDNIHPSIEGIKFISAEVADFLHSNNLIN
ncbi:MAG: hypothetical protein ACD_30C00091G0002 [uncultured bacterium]|uniref:SGNH hydrolase-type esterase domain-containing protein n=3 Tax=Candidatus Daviesiibacteriota TaxID=1752718 RepID=A0A0G0EWZ3_9BACT|nr:MAG: hypothetical protein ACD_30C00091G0002 [uncultured bacterium]KKQ10012.1 MAG: hypothetical protein US19_C0009G0014 [Candidatus Daviesbacteria bacterium GW2011_GWB1_36_5]OGE33012.1 MAG: hypothetical protein A3C99_00675 [Candidatus Daviesbacteria bacterium RIFCSPHIGHO2_02_FULL_37_9]OGE36694.1 MAG: hypothetical protein A3E66_02060 [Candidatus Daviesbacteria bacterium RIFCSPHIGHO2_12_FULL_37_16]